MTQAFARWRRHFASPGTQRQLDAYLRDSRRPLHALVFLLPAVLTYEIWALLRLMNGGGQELVAHSALRGLLEWFGFVHSGGRDCCSSRAC